MRITNKIMHNNSIYNINNNKVTEDGLNTQIATGKKLTRPSDDPVIAIRALRLRSNVTELSQYYEKNAKDAESWLNVTEDSLSTITDVLTALIQQCNKGVNQYETLDDIDTILTEMSALSDEYYSTGNEDYAGRYIFTGYRTQQSLTFKDDESTQYIKLHDEFNAEDVDTSQRVIGAYTLTASDSTFPAESDMASCNVGRIRLSYDNVDPDVGNVSVRYRSTMTVPATSILSTSKTEDTVYLTYKDGDGITRKVNISTNTDNNTNDDNKVTVTEADGSVTTYSARINDDYGYTITGENSMFGPFSMTLNQNGVATATDISVDVNGTDLIIKYTDASGSPREAQVSTLQSSTITESNGSTTTYSITSEEDGGYTIKAVNSASGTSLFTVDHNGKVKAYDITATVSDTALSTFDFTVNGEQTTIQVPLTGASDAPYEVDVFDLAGNAYSMTVNTDGTYQINNESSLIESGENVNVVNLSSNGSVHSSYVETVIKPGVLNAPSLPKVIDSTTTEDIIDDIYVALSKDTENECFCINSYTGEILLSAKLKEKLESLTDITNANNINVMYDKSSWLAGDTRPENLMKCTNIDDGVTVVYNGGNSSHIMEYDVGYGQTIEVNTTANEVFTTSVRRDVEDLKRLVSRMKDIKTMMNTMNSNLAATTDDNAIANIKKEIAAAQKSYDYMKEELKDMFGKKITSMQEALDKANVAVTENGTRSSRLSMVQSRLQNQLTTFKTLQSDNEDIDMAETATNLSTAELIYQASLMATSKIMKESLMNYI
ncbi:Flagellin FlgL [Butyrivibrio fibrisolvens DSM 3071]|uniref:Flagellin n=1 Tax=Butyrivibrio fibrisolvens DSM 3071 TaxID=1121131 RepID=A0A1M5ZWG8_BUTFI|nr:flagellin [Butyrivibrio fibrisolvens]SHI28506.1 Flagellin FlgL [Butyrivibrio fibrisolvens DSM 3071]